MFRNIVEHPEYYAGQTFKIMLTAKDYMNRTPLMLATGYWIMGEITIPLLIKAMQEESMDQEIEYGFHYAVSQLYSLKPFIKELTPGTMNRLLDKAIPVLKSFQKDTVNSEKVTKATHILDYINK